MEMGDQKVHQARQFLRDYIGSNQDKLKSWLDGASRENFGAELILLSLESRKISDAYDLSGIALGFAMWLFNTVDGGHLAAQKVVAYNTALGETIPTEVLHFLENPPKPKKSERPNELQQSTAIGLIHAALEPFRHIISPAHLASLERATREFESKYPWF